MHKGNSYDCLQCPLPPSFLFARTFLHKKENLFFHIPRTLFKIAVLYGSSLDKQRAPERPA